MKTQNTSKLHHITRGQIVLTVILTLFALSCLLPMVLIIIVAFSSEASVKAKGFSFFPNEWSLEAFKYVSTFGHQVLVSYGVTIFITVVGTLFGLLVMGCFAYALSRNSFMLRKAFAFMLLITMLFSGGMLSGYLVNTTMYHLKDNLLVLILPGIGAMQIIILRTFIQSNVPDSIIESAKIDGAGEVRTFFQIVLPIIVPALAAVGFMLAIGYWNDWMGGFLYIESPSKTPLQLLLIRTERNVDFLLKNVVNTSPEMILLRKNLPQQTSRMAILLVATGPIMFAYPFFQKYFIRGLTIGSVKG